MRSGESAMAAGPGRDPALVLVAHGASHNPTAGTSLRRLAEALRRRCADTTVAVAYVHGEPTLPAVLDSLGTEDAVCVVPMFAAEGHHTREVVRPALDAARRKRPLRRLMQAPALGTSPAYTASLARRLLALVSAAGIDPRGAAMLAIGHGRRGLSSPPDDAARRLAEALHPAFATSLALYLDGEPAAASWATRVAETDVVVAPVFFSDAQHASVDVPAIFGGPARSPGGADGIEGPWICAGRRIWSVALPPASGCVADIVVGLAQGAAAPPTGPSSAFGRRA
ncbi:MAG: hypothetical protein JNK67_14685 [Alphaproteobacteria bacterium]|nr:hypothetical protein [Alphaproteobacteria bacterium]